jgi:hypothetical protein
MFKVEPHANGIGQELARDLIGQVPGVVRSGFRQPEALFELADNRFDPLANPPRQLEPPPGSAFLHVLAQGHLQVDAQRFTMGFELRADRAIRRPESLHNL